MKIYPYPGPEAEARLAKIASRAPSSDEEITASVRKILAAVREEGNAAVLRYARKFDAPNLEIERIRVTEAEFAAAETSVTDEFLSAIKRAARQVGDFHKHQKRNSWITTDRPGTVLGQIFRPVSAAGIYVPGARGGETPLVSTVIMCAVPAKIAGVERIAMVTPSRPDGGVDPHLLAAARIAGVTEIHKIGSAWAVGALAYGTETVAPVDVIVGPGNIFVAAAKQMVSGTVGIDMIAGPSEVLIIADHTADPAFAAADLLSQAEHDPLASSVFITDAPDLAGQVKTEVARQMAGLPRKKIAEASWKNFGAILLVDDLDTAFSLSDRIAPEHLELLVKHPFECLDKVRNAGAVFLGPWSPEPMGDYIAGPNHVLPTAGTARFSSALSVDDFIKKTSVVQYSGSAFQKEAADAIRLAEIEGLAAHAASVRIRMKGE